MKEVVLDASAALQYLLPDTPELHALAAKLFADIRAGRITATVPIIFMNEAAAPIAKAVRGRRVSAELAHDFFVTLGQTPLNMQVEILSPGDWYERAMTWHCGVADSAYLSLALDLKAPIVTTDRGLITAARATKAKLYWPAD